MTTDFYDELASAVPAGQPQEEVNMIVFGYLLDPQSTAETLRAAAG